MVNNESKVSPEKEVLFQEVNGEAVLLNQESGKYFSLDETGTRMWQALVEHNQIEAALQVLLEEFDAPPARVRQDLLDFIGKLEGHGLLRVD